MFKPFSTIIRHEILLTYRQAHTWLTPLLFFVMIAMLFPMALGADASVLQPIAPPIIWVAALLSVLMSVGNIFRLDAQDGYLDLLLLSKQSLSSLVLCKIGTHWLTHCLPLIIISPLLGLMLNLNGQQITALVLTLLLGTPVLSLLGGIGAALLIGVKQQGLLLPILIMPLYIPVLIFGTGTLLGVAASQPVGGYYAIMGALILVTLAFTPLFTSLALRVGVSQS
jgi:heme exporter protein B